MMTTSDDAARTELVERILARLSARTAAAPVVVEYGRLHEAAAVLGAFDADTIRPAASSAPGDSIEELLTNSMPTVDASGVRRWTLTSDVRVATLRQIREHGRVTTALAANPRHGDDPLATAIERYLTGTATPVDQQPLAELSTTYQACEWLRAAGVDVPDRDAIQRRTDWLTLLEPFEFIAGDFFRGRKEELEWLRSYAGVLPPGSIAESARRFVERVFSLDQKPPLMIYGPGGVGKSALVARFILEHARARETDRFPFIYLDFDRPDVNENEPLTLLIEAVRQIGIQFPEIHDSCEQIRREWLRQLVPGDFLAQVRSRAAADFGSLIQTIGGPDRPVILVLDTFEEVQARSEANVEAIWTFLDELQRALPLLRSIIAGRSPVGRPSTEIELGGLDEEAAVGYLRARGVADEYVASRLARRFGGNPLTLRLASELVEREGIAGSHLDDEARDRLLVSFDSDAIQRVLYTRILGHIHDPDVRRLAHPGMVLRRVTPELILHVLAEPCGLIVNDLPQARRLFEALGREVSLVRSAGDGALIHREDLRQLMLRALEADQPEKARTIRELAVGYYERLPAAPHTRAEEIYHRLALGHDRKIIDQRWMLGVQTYLSSAVAEFSGARRAYLASRLGLEVDEQTRQLADIEDWEVIVERNALELIAHGRLDEALSQITTRSDRSPSSPLYGLQATVLGRLLRWDEALAVLDQGIGRAIADGNRPQLFRLALRRAELVVHSDRSADVASSTYVLRQVGEGLTETADRLAVAARLHALERVQGSDTTALLDFLRELFDATSDDRLGDDPTLGYWAGASFRTAEDTLRLARVLRICGLVRGGRGGARELAAAIAQFDKAISAEVGRPPGALASVFRVPRAKSLTASWATFLLEAPGETVAATLVEMLDRDGGRDTTRLADALATYFVSSLGAEFRGAAVPLTTQVTAGRGRRGLSAADRSAIVDALAATYPDRDALRNLLRYSGLGNIDSIAPTTIDHRSSVMALVEYTEKQRSLELLVLGARDAFPGDAALAAAAERLGLSTIVPGSTAAVRQIIGADPTIDQETWRERLGAIEGQVCRVEVGDRAFGTGFLIGVDLVLAPDHLLPSKPEFGKGFHVRFDLKTGPKGRIVTPGTVFDVVEVLARRGYSERPTGLGYALLRIDGAPGAQPIGPMHTESSGVLRRWIDLGEHAPTPKPGTGLVIVEHPNAGPVRLGHDPNAILGFSDDGARVYYRLPTEPGSAGSPCFTPDLQLVAIHVGSSSADHGAPPGACVGVLKSRVLDDLREQGFGDSVSVAFV